MKTYFNLNISEARKELLNRSDFTEIVKISHNKPYIKITTDCPESYYQDDEGDIFETFPIGKTWTQNGSCSSDITVEWFPNLLSIYGIKIFMKQCVNWFHKTIKEKDNFFYYHPFGTWSHWMFVIDSLESIKSEIAFDKLRKNSSKKDLQDLIKLITKQEIDGYLAENYNKLSDRFYSQKNDPTGIVCTDDHDYRDGYSNKKMEAILNDWVKLIYPEGEDLIFKF